MGLCAMAQEQMQSRVNAITCSDSMLFLKEHAAFSADIIYSDPPYGLGSEVIIRSDGKPDYSNASDFMGKWDMPCGDYWEQWFKEAFRVLKHGGYCIMFGMDRQLLLGKYYAALAGFMEKQSMYWYFINNFPKSSDLSKNLDKNAGVERKVIGVRNDGKGSDSGSGCYAMNNGKSEMKKEIDITTPSTPLAKKYNGYHYSISPLKQTNETIMVFQKPYKTGSCLHDVLAYENGDKEVCCGALNIEGGRVPTSENLSRICTPQNNKTSYSLHTKTEFFDNSKGGRYPAQTFCDSQVANMLDKQSGVIKSSRNIVFGGFGAGTITFGAGTITSERGYDDIGGISKILHICKFEKGEHDLYMYCPKVGVEERNKGLDGFEDNYETGCYGDGLGNVPKVNGLRPNVNKNIHPTLKPISLNERILKLFKTPNPQLILYPFAGAGSEIIGGLRAGFTDWQGCEINPDYVKIAEARLKDYLAQKKLAVWSKTTKTLFSEVI